MANSSELLHFLKQDTDVSPYLKDSYQVLAQSVQMAFRHLVQCVEQELRQLMSAFLDVTEDADMEDGDIDSMMDMNSPDDIMGERSFRYGPSGRPMGGDSWLGELILWLNFFSKGDAGAYSPFAPKFKHVLELFFNMVPCTEHSNTPKYCNCTQPLASACTARKFVKVLKDATGWQYWEHSTYS